MAKQFLKDGKQALKALLKIAESVPILGMVAKTCSKIYKISESVSTNNANCKKVASRFRCIEAILGKCAQEYQQSGINPTSKQTVCLTNLQDDLMKMEQLVETYVNQRRISKYWRSNQFKKKYEAIDKDIDASMQMLQAVQNNLNADKINESND